MDVTNQIRLERERREALVKGNILQSMGVSESLSKATPTDITKGEKSNELFDAEEIEKAHNELFEKAVYADTAQNRKLGRVGQEWHRGKANDVKKKEIFDKLDDESFEALSTATKKDLPWLKSQLKNKVTDEDGKNYQQAVKITIKELEGK